MPDTLSDKIRTALQSRLDTAHEPDGPAELHITQCRPASVIRSTEAALRILDRHAPFWSPLGECGCENCSNGVTRAELELWPCPDVRDLADLAGVDHD